MDKREALKALEEEMRQDKALPLHPANLVFGEGDPDAAVLFIGEAPGQREDELGRPFVGRAGQLLDKLIVSIGWQREEVYITNIVKRRPPLNRDPLPEEIEAYRPYLARQIEILHPVLIAPLGRFSMNYFLPEAKITRDQGKLFRAGDRLIFPLLHPAAALRGTGAMQSLVEAFGRLPKAVEKCRSLDLASVPDATPAPETGQKSLL
ncbi:MAG: uracil-DNA glycosylase [bacterium]|nr:uracil-DNA glycosylase [bacterium]